MTGKKLSEEQLQDEVARLRAYVEKLEAAQIQNSSENPRYNLLNEFFEQAGSAIALISSDGKFLEANQSFFELSGYSQPQLSGLHFQDICYPQDSNAIASVLTGNQPELQLETQLRDRQGHDIGVVLNLSYRPQTTTSLAFIIVQLRLLNRRESSITADPPKDLSATKNQVGKPAGFYAPSAELLENITEALVVLTPKWEIAYVNQLFEKMVFLKRADLIGRSIWDIFSDLNSSSYYELFQKVLADGITRECEVNYPVSNNWYLIRACRIEQNLVIFTSYNNAQHKALEGLRESEERYHALADRMPSIVWTANAEGWTEYYNQRWFEYTGQTAQITLGWGWEKLIHPEDLDDYMKKWRRVLETGAAFEIESRFLRWDGVYRWQLGRALPVRNETGEIISWVGTYTDIDDQKQAEERLNLQATVLNQVNDIVVAIDNDLRVIYWNHAAEEMYNITKEEIIGQSLEMAYVNQWPTKAEEFQVWESFQAVGHWRGEVMQTKTRTGEVIYIEITTSRLKNKDGQQIGMLGVIRDNTRRRVSDEAVQFLAEASVLLSTSLNYRSTLHSLAQLVVPGLADWCFFDLLDENEVMQRVAVAHNDPLKENLLVQLARRYPLYNNQNLQLLNILQTGEPQIVDNIEPEGVRASALDQEQAAMWRMLNPRSMLTVPLTFQGRVSGVFTCVSTRPDFFKDWHLQLAQELARRASMSIENSLLFQQTQQALEAQRRLDIAKDQFLSIASHELRTPLTSIRGYVQLLLRQHDKNQPAEMTRDYEKEGRMLRNLDGQIIRMDELIGEMLDITRIENGQLELHYSEQTELVSFLLRLIEQQEEPAANTDHALVAKLEVTELYAQVDETRLEQVLNNLIINAMKYSPPGTSVEIGLEASGDGVQFKVKDYGFGINPQEQPQIFQRFYRADTGGDINIDGLGLGLYISHEIIVRHGGRIWFDSAQEQGTTFYVWLPLVPPHEAT